MLNRIAGERVDGGGTRFDRRDPADDRGVVSSAPESTAPDVAAAVDAACAAWPAWAATPATERSERLHRAAAALQARQEELATLISLEQGKLRGDALGEVARSVRNLRAYASEALRVLGHTFPQEEPGVEIRTRVGPLGVVGVITPWNFPVSLSTRKLGPALAMGNTLVWKPSPFAPGVTDLVADAFDEAGFPAGVINVVHGTDAGRCLVADDRVVGVTFTGSTATGERIRAQVGVGRRCQLELGGNNPVVVLADADLDRAAQIAVRSAFSLAGQACTGAGRVYVEHRVHDELLERMAGLARSYVLGPGTSASSTLGPLVDRSSLERMEAVVDDARSRGAAVLCGGARATGADVDHGWFFPPTILTGLDSSAVASREEVFGPVVGVEPVGSLDEAITRCNDTEYGLAAAVCTTSAAAAAQFCVEVRAGMLKVNRPTTGAPFGAPFGGLKRSSDGSYKEQLGPGVIDFYVSTQTIEVAI
ncbi:MAG: aldehyde dehydrogenase family protein [Ilumatobacteraceae bacterium]